MPMHLHLGAAPRVAGPDGPARELAWLDAALLAWLALEGPTPRARLAQLLWPEKDVDAARNSLRQRLFQLRKVLGVELVTGSTTLALAGDLQHDLDTADGVLGTVAADAIAPGEFARWLEQQRTRRRDRVRQQHAERADAAEAARDFAEALVHARELLALEPLSEDAHRRVMRLHYRAGDRAAALLAFDQLERLLKDEVGARPSEATQALLRTIEAEDRALAVPAGVPAGVLRPPRLVGRDAELAALAAGVAAGQVVAVIGEAGMGKSRLLQAFAQGRPGVAGCAARPGDAGVPFASLARLVQAVAASAASHGLPALDGAAQGHELQRLALLQGVRALLAAQPALEVLVLDDLHFADAASIELLRLLVDDDPPERRRAWLLAYRPVEAGTPLQALLDGLVEQARWRPVPLAPLSLAQLTELVASLALPGVDAVRIAPPLLQRTGGNPLFVLETLKQAWTDGTLDAATQPLPRVPTVMRLIERRLTQLSAPALALARCAAVAGQRFTPALAARVLAVHPLALADAWAELEAAQIVRDQQFVHDLYHEAALASVPRAIARHLHAEVAAQLEQAEPGSVAPAALAAHWLAADQPGRAVPHLQAAARAARDALDPVLAARFLGELAQAQQAVGADAAAWAAANEAVTELGLLAHGAEFAAAIDRLDALARTPPQRAHVCEHRAAMHHFRGEPALALAAIERGLAELVAEDHALRRLNLRNLQGMVLRRVNRLAEARAALGEAVALARATPEAQADLPHILNNLALVHQHEDDHLGASGLLQESAGLTTDPQWRAQVLNNLAVSLVARGQSALAYEQCLAAARLCAAVRSEGAAALLVTVSLGSIGTALGRYREAIAHLQHGEAILQTVSHHLAIDLRRMYVAIWLDLGRVNQARQALVAALAACPRPEAHLSLGLTRVRFALAAGEDAQALAAPLEAAARAQNQWHVLRRLLLALVPLRAPDAAADELEALLHTPAVRDNAGAAIPVLTRLAQAQLAAGRSGPALRSAQRAADALDAAWPHDFSCAEIWLTLARAQLAQRDERAAAEAAARGAAWVHAVAAQHLDEPYRDGWLHRNPVNDALLTLAARLTQR